MDVSRRWFLGRTLAVAAAATVPMPSLGRYPVVVGDGIHNDWEGLQAMLDGRPVDLLTDKVRLVGGDGFCLQDGRFLISRTLTAKIDKPFSIKRCVIISTDNFEGSAMLKFPYRANINLIDSVLFRK